MELKIVVNALVETALKDPLFEDVRTKIQADVNQAIDNGLKDIVIGDGNIAEVIGVKVLRERIYDNVRYCSIGFTVLGFVCRLFPGAKFNAKVFGDRTKTAPIDLNSLPTDVGPTPKISSTNYKL